MRHKEPTHTSLVEEILRSTEDFFTVDMLVARGAGTPHQVRSTLIHLRIRRAADVVINPDGTGWWFALPKDYDTRSRKVVERAPEVKPRRPRRKKNG